MTKISLPKTELDKFLALSSYTNLTTECIQLLPDTEYIKVDLKRGFCTMSLTSVSSFVTYMFSCTDQQEASILVSILSLREYLKGKRKEVIIITDEQENTVFYDGNAEVSKPKNAVIELKNFTDIPSAKGLAFTRLDKNLILKLIQSKKYVQQKDKLIPLINVSSINGDILLSTNSTISCLYKLETSHEFSIFSLKEIDLISEFEYADYAKTDNWNIIKYKTIVYGQRLPEGINPEGVHKQFYTYVDVLDKAKTLKVSVDQLYDFCNTVKVSHKDPTVSSVIEVIDGGIMMYYEDGQNKVKVKQPVAATVIGYSVGYSFKIFQFEIMKVMDSLNSEWINISECTDQRGVSYIGFWLDSDPSFHSICSKAI